ncbi:MAG: TolC family protein [bacterium]
MYLIILILSAGLIISKIFSIPLTLELAEKKAIKNNLELKKEEMAKQAVKWEKWDAIAQYLPSISIQTMNLHLDDETVKRANAFSNQQGSGMPDTIIGINGYLLGYTGNPSNPYVPLIDVNTGNPKDSATLLMQPLIDMFSMMEFDPVYQNSWESGITINQKISNGLKELIAIFQMAPSKIDLVYGTYDLTREMIIINTRKAYYGMIKAKESVGLLEKIVEISERTLKKTKIQFEAKQISGDILLAKEAQLASDRAELEKMKSIKNMSRFMLEDIIGGETEENITIDNVSRFEEKYEKAGIGDGTINNSSDLRIVKGIAGMTKAGKNITLTNALPNINFQYSRKWIADETINPWDSRMSYSYAVVMNWALGISNITSAKMQRYQVKKAQLDVKIKERDLKTQKRVKRDNLENLRKSVAAAKMADQAQQKSFEIMTKRYESGFVNTIDYMTFGLLCKQRRIAYLEALFGFLEELDGYNRLIGRLEENNGR